MQHSTVLGLTGLEIFFIITTIVSLVVNILQARDRKTLLAPLSNSLLAVFNDIKAKTNSVYFNYNAIFNPNNPHQDIQTLKWEYGLFAQNVVGYLNGFQEALVAALVTLNPDDKEGCSGVPCDRLRAYN